MNEQDTKPVNDMMGPFEIAFEEWDRRYREDPESFINEATHILKYTPRTYGEACAAYFVGLLDELSGGSAWNTIKRKAENDTPPAPAGEPVWGEDINK